MTKEIKLVEPWWNENRNPITGWKTYIRKLHKEDQIEVLKYADAYPTLEIKNK